MSKFYEKYKAAQEKKRLELIEEERNYKLIKIRSITLFGNLPRIKTRIKNI